MPLEHAVVYVKDKKLTTDVSAEVQHFLGEAELRAFHNAPKTKKDRGLGWTNERFNQVDCGESRCNARSEAGHVRHTYGSQSNYWERVQRSSTWHGKQRLWWDSCTTSVQPAARLRHQSTCINVLMSIKQSYQRRRWRHWKSGYTRTNELIQT